VDIDRETYKILLHVYRNRRAREEVLTDKFGPKTPLVLTYLAAGDCVSASLDGKNPLPFDRLPFPDITGAMFMTTVKGNVEIERRRFELWKWLIPLIFSAISLLFSLFLLFFKS